MKGIAGFYYVYIEACGLYECKAKGIFRKENQKPLVGDEVEMDVLDEAEKKGNIVRILPRRNALIRPAVANVDQALVIFAAEDPKPNFMLLDRFLVTMEQQGVPVSICFNKKDLGDAVSLRQWKDTYEAGGYRVIFTSATEEEHLPEIEELLRGKTTVVAGPSGVGKSSITNRMQGEVSMETGEISRKLGRGKHTTRHSQVIPAGEGTYLLDTPGFSSLYLEGLEKEELKDYFPEFHPYEGRCRYLGCVHIHEPECAVKEAMERGEGIRRLRYENYLGLYEELRAKRKY